MKNTKEMHALITAVYCINKTNGSEDKDITNLCRYIVLRCMNGNPNMMDILCIGKTKDEILPYLRKRKHSTKNIWRLKIDERLQTVKR